MAYVFIPIDQEKTNVCVIINNVEKAFSMRKEIDEYEEFDWPPIIPLNSLVINDSSVIANGKTFPYTIGEYNEFIIKGNYFTYSVENSFEECYNVVVNFSHFMINIGCFDKLTTKDYFENALPYILGIEANMPIITKLISLYKKYA